MIVFDLFNAKFGQQLWKVTFVLRILIFPKFVLLARKYSLNVHVIFNFISAQSLITDFAEETDA